MSVTDKQEISAGTETDARAGLIAFVVVLSVVAVLFIVPRIMSTDPAALSAASTVFVAIVVQAMPFLVLGVALSAAITAFVPVSFWQRALPRRTSLAVPVAGCAGAVLPGCECASVPVSSALMGRGVAPAAALTFLLAAPAINPVVIVSTLVAFPNDPAMAGARFAASLATAVIMGWLWMRFGRGDWLAIRRRTHLEQESRGATFLHSAGHDFLHAGGFLVLGALAAAIINVFVPREWLNTVADKPLLSVIALALLAVVLSICSEADAFVAASLNEFSPAAKLAFLVVGPMVDIKLISMQIGMFGRAFAIRFAPATFAVAIAMSLTASWVIL